ncbi:hypothetical protein [Treponema sp.]|uniref:hypothetical protein n=1 Tax=Treponema sp. TaxID=166 RepID=UPI00298E811C|nr:hypothetical protein [Treponema sp.]MCR5613485.1 hypothetical protein [Treponema sp.]
MNKKVIIVSGSVLCILAIAVIAVMHVISSSRVISDMRFDRNGNFIYGASDGYKFQQLDKYDKNNELVESRLKRKGEPVFVISYDRVYDENGLCTKIVETQRGGKEILSTKEILLYYNEKNQKVKEVSSDGSVKLFSYDNHGHLSTEESDVGTTKFQYIDKFKRSVPCEYLYDEVVIKWIYDGNGRCLKIDSPDHTYEYFYDNIRTFLVSKSIERDKDKTFVTISKNGKQYKIIYTGYQTEDEKIIEEEFSKYKATFYFNGLPKRNVVYRVPKAQQEKELAKFKQTELNSNKN